MRNRLLKFIPVILTLSLMSSLSAQDYSGSIDISGLVSKIDSIEQRLTAFIARETASRKATDSAIIALHPIDTLTETRFTGDHKASAAPGKGCKTGTAADTGAQPKPDSCLPEEKEAMQIGGLVAVDYASPLDDFKSQTLSLGRIELRAVVNINANVRGFITLLTEGDLEKIRFYQAAADLTPDNLPIELIVGQQIFNHGLMTTRLINYPLGYGLVLPNQPGVSAMFTMNNFKISLAGLMTETVTSEKCDSVLTIAGDTIELPGKTSASERLPGAVASFDYSFTNSSLLHLSISASHDDIDIDAACALILEKFTFDAEVYSQLREPAGTGKAATYCAGIAYAISDNVSLAVRNDGLSGDRFRDLTMLFCGGIVVKIFGDCYAAIEYDYTKPPEGDASSAIALEFGLQSTLKLPGFQRKSLTTGE